MRPGCPLQENTSRSESTNLSVSLSPTTTLIDSLSLFTPDVRPFWSYMDTRVISGIMVLVVDVVGFCYCCCCDSALNLSGITLVTHVCRHVGTHACTNTHTHARASHTHTDSRLLWSSMPACISVCLPACLHVCLPACLFVFAVFIVLCCSQPYRLSDSQTEPGSSSDPGQFELPQKTTWPGWLAGCQPVNQSIQLLTVEDRERKKERVSKRETSS